jgi:hypothetical protein
LRFTAETLIIIVRLFGDHVVVQRLNPAALFFQGGTAVGSFSLYRYGGALCEAVIMTPAIAEGLRTACEIAGWRHLGYDDVETIARPTRATPAA